MATTKLMTAQDLLQLPDDNHRYDLIRGELQRMPPAGDEHGYVAMDLGRRVANHVADNSLGRCYAAETGFILEREPDTVLAPDFAFVRAGRVQSSDPYTGYRPLAPDLVIDVLSPTARRRETEEKMRLYVALGVRLAWLVDLRRRTVTVFAAGRLSRDLSADDVLDGEDVLPGFRLPVTSIVISSPAS
jgi:Uma2 family endonuclease